MLSQRKGGVRGSRECARFLAHLQSHAQCLSVSFKNLHYQPEDLYFLITLAASSEYIFLH